MLITRRTSFFHAPALIWGLAVAGGFLTIGVAIVKAPAVAWALVGALLGMLLLQVPAYAWVTTAVLAATLSRLLVATGFVPQIVNFFHFPLVLGAALVAAAGSRSQLPISRSISIGCVGLLFLSFVSWVFNGGELLRPPLTWLVFLEPFLLVYALVRLPPPAGKANLLWRLALGIPFIQFPLGLWQAFTKGLADNVQGSFVGMGAGHHVAGAVALTGTLICAAQGLSATTFRTRLAWLLAGVVLFIVPVLADAKQNIAAFLPAFILLLSMFVRVRKTGIVVALPIFALALLAASSYYPPLQNLTDKTVVSDALSVKAQSLAVIAHRLSATPEGWLFGVGPGNSVSRVGLMGMEPYLNPNSPVALLGLSAAPLTREIWAMDTDRVTFVRSSVMKGWYSWAGLFGDLGLVGLGLYLWMASQLWLHLKTYRRWETAAARAALVMAGALGMMFNWLEEPGFTLMVAFIVGLALIARENQHVSVEGFDRSQFLPAGWR